jgi:hypothetical protein
VKPGRGAWPNLLAALTALALLPGAVGISVTPGKSSPDRGTATARFHAGSRTTEGNPDPACAGKGCHLASSHRKGGTAAFLNMHEGNVSCLACHGRDAENRWVASPSGPGRASRLTYSPENGTGAPHDGLDVPATCERCHSEGGRDRLAAAGWKEIPQGFASPIPVRMLREGGRRWVPDDGR